MSNMFTDNTPWRVFLSPAQSLSRGTASLESGFWQASAKPTIGNTFTHIPMFFNRSQSSSVNGATNLEKKKLSQRVAGVACPLAQMIQSRYFVPVHPRFFYKHSFL